MDEDTLYKAMVPEEFPQLYCVSRRGCVINQIYNIKLIIVLIKRCSCPPHLKASWR